MCLGAMSGGVRGARWTQIGAIARVDVPWRPVEWRLPCQMNCRKGGQRPCTAVCGSSASFRQIIARADVPWSDVWRGSRRSMDTNRCHRASGCALEAPRMAIAVPDELQESEGAGSDRALTAVCGRSGFFLLIIARADVPWSDVWRGPRPDGLPESERPGSAPAATLSQCSVATRVCLSWNKDFQLPRRYN